MLKTKLVSSQEKAFIDESIDKFRALQKISALGGERLSVQILYVDEGEPYLPRRPFCDLIVSGELAEFVTVRDVRNVPVDRPLQPWAVDEGYLRTTPGIYPDLLTPMRYGGKVVISQDKLRSLWIEIAIPENFSGKTKLTFDISLKSGSAGETGGVELAGERIASESVTIEVLPAALPEQELIFTQWFYCDCLAAYYNVPAWSDRHWEIIENFAKAAAKRGRNMLYTPLLTPALNVLEPFERVPTQLVDVTVVRGEYFFGFEKVDKWVDMCDRIGIKYFEISHFYNQDQAQHSAKVYGTVDGEYKQIFGWETLALDPEYIRFLRGMINAFIAHMKGRGDDKRCYYHISDEPTIATLSHYLQVKNNIADLLAGYEIMDALSDFDFYQSGAVSCPVPVTYHAMPFVEAKVPDLWVYYAGFPPVGYSNQFVAMPSWRNRSLGMQLYKYKVAGFLHWGYNYYNNRASGDAINPYLDLGGEDWVPAGDTFMVYPDADGTPLESIRMLVMEEALQDIRAMKLAEKYYSYEKVVEVMEEALGDEITFTRCTYSAEEMLRVRAAVNELIRQAVE